MVCVSNGENLSVCRSFRSARVGMVTEFLSVVRTEKVLGLWKGVSPVSIFLLSLSLSLSLSHTHTHTHSLHRINDCKKHCPSIT